MRILPCVVLALLAACSTGSPSTAQDAAQTAPAAATAQDARMAWWREARFGMFLHWGLYAIPAGNWQGGSDYGEWIRDSARIPVGTYEQFQPQWNPVQFDADAWASMAAAAGMKYVVLTSKHHDGFCLFDSKQTDWDVMNTPFGRDVCKELAAACARHGVRFCTYHSIMDWHHPDYLPRRGWEKADRPEGDADFARFERYLHAQVTEVIENYHPAVMWFDGEWESTWNHERGLRLFDLCRRLAPDMIVNNRVDVHRGGMGGFNGSSEAVGDFATPEQEIPATGMPGVDWESCMTMNRHWGWNQADTDWKSTKDLLRNLIDIASKGGNYLLNIGPRADGTFPPQAVERLAEIGKWMEVNGESIHGTTASVFEATPWGRCTVRRMSERTRLYLHLFDWPKDGRFELPFANEVVGRPYILGDPKASVGPDIFADSESLAAVLLRSDHPDPIATVLVVDVMGEPIVFSSPKITADSDQFVGGLEVTIATSTQGGAVHYTLDGSTPTFESPRMPTIFHVPLGSASLHLAESCTIRARTGFQGRWVGNVVERTFTKVEPSLAVEPVAPNHGLRVARHVGDWSKIPANRAKLVATGTGTTATVTCGKNPGEHVLLRFTGFIDAPQDDLYRFALASDDGSALWIDGELVVDNDGLHASVEKQGTRALGKGLHPIEVVWFNATGGSDLKLQWALPGAPFAEVPTTALRY